MKKFSVLFLIITLISLSGCAQKVNSETKFTLDTVSTITASCSKEIIKEAFSLCQEYENLLSRTIKGSDIYNLNHTNGYTSVNEKTLKIIEKSLYYSELSQGKFDITIYEVSSLWDFNKQIIPSKNEIAEAIKNVDYQSIEIKDNQVNTNGKKIDLGGIAKGYIADEILKYLKEQNVKNGIINLGGNIIAFGREYKIGIQKPFKQGNAEILCIKDKSVVTSGIYQRYIEKNGEFYHHILDTKTGYGVENSLASVTIIGDSSLDCDALSTVCMLLGKEESIKLIEKTPNTEAIFIEKDDTVTYTSGLIKKNRMLYLK